MQTRSYRKKIINETNVFFQIYILNLLHIILVKQSSNHKPDELNMENIINDCIFNQHNSVLNKDNRYMKVTPKSELRGFA